MSTLSSENDLSLSNRSAMNLDETTSSLSGLEIKLESRMSRHSLNGFSNFCNFLLVGFFAAGASSVAVEGSRGVLVVWVGGLYNPKEDVFWGVALRFLPEGR